MGRRFERPTGILELMDDLGEAMSAANPDVCMLGGGNPAAIPGVQAAFREQWAALHETPAYLDRILGQYDTAQGQPRFLESLAAYLNRRFSWGIGPENIMVTNGSQTACFYVFNLFAGPAPDGTGRKILLPLSPEYIGYADQGIHPDTFVSVPGTMTRTADHRFKYHIDFDALPLDDSIAGIAVSRPTNPTGNVLTDDEVTRLSALAKSKGIPLIIDNAYGSPFPGILFREVNLTCEPHIILSMSLSKLGLPGTRTGMIIADAPVVRQLTAVNAVAGLASGNLGQSLIEPLVRSGEIDRLCAEEIRPYYESHSRQALEAWHDELPASVEWCVHEPEGSMFHWVRFPGLPISTAELYQRLKKRGVLVIPGHYFFYGQISPSIERDECIRVHTAMDAERVRIGIQRIAREIAAL